MLLSTGSQRVRHDLATEPPPPMSSNDLYWSFLQSVHPKARYIRQDCHFLRDSGEQMFYLYIKTTSAFSLKTYIPENLKEKHRKFKETGPGKHFSYAMRTGALLLGSVRRRSQEEETATPSSILAGKIPWTEKPGSSMGSQSRPRLSTAKPTRRREEGKERNQVLVVHSKEGEKK